MITFIFTIAIFLFINSYLDFQSKSAVLKAGFTVNLEIPNNSNQNSNLNNDLNSNFNMITETTEESKRKWFLEIPIIELNAEIEEGTTKEIMDKFIGHFEESEKWVGNVCLAAHNRGYENNYFSKVKKLKEGDKIIYHYKDSQREYFVQKNIIIKDTDLSYIENTKDNTITLITCVENEPNYRRCVQAIENK